jgi:predicted transcriptional regulator
MAFRIRAGTAGVAVRLHDLESAVMDAVWSRRWAEFSVADVHGALERPIAYTTVMTTVARLHKKGLLSRRRDGKRYLYEPRMNRETFLASTARDVIERLGDGLEHGTLALLAHTVTTADHETLEQLETMIRRRRRELDP